MRCARPIVAVLLTACTALAQAAEPGGAPEPAAAGDRSPTPGQSPTTSPPAAESAVPLTSHPRRWFVIPVVSYLPETGFGGGASAGMHFQVEGAPRPTSLFATVLYTTESQGLLDLAAESMRPGGAVLAARGRILHFPDRFYGIGPHTRDSQIEHYTRQSVELAATAEFPVRWLPGVRVGPRVELRVEEITDKEEGGELSAGTVPGASGSSYAAGGFSATWDTRDGTFWPSRGSLVQAWAVVAPPAAARGGQFARGVLELRHFVPLGGRRVLGLHAYAEAASAAAPFTLLPRIGNTRFLRGIREGRYRDHLDWALQAELRSPLFWRLSGTLFGAAGDVAPSLAAVDLGDAKLAGGVGLRYRLTDEGANIRVDVASSRFGVQLYVLVLEAF